MLNPGLAKEPMRSLASSRYDLEFYDLGKRAAIRVLYSELNEMLAGRKLCVRNVYSGWLDERS